LGSLTAKKWGYLSVVRVLFYRKIIFEMKNIRLIEYRGRQLIQTLEIIALYGGGFEEEWVNRCGSDDGHTKLEMIALYHRYRRAGIPYPVWGTYTCHEPFVVLRQGIIGDVEERGSIARKIGDMILSSSWALRAA
jgi:hypothetical protein